MSATLELSAAMEDYLEVILKLTEREGVARVTDIAQKLNIAKSSVNQAIENLVKLKLVNQQKYGPVTLTEKGKKHAERIRQKHRILKKFLIEVLGVQERVAEKDACLMEHVVSPTTMEKLIAFLEESSNDNFNTKEKTTNKREGGDQMSSSSIMALSTLPIGQKGKVIRITAKGNVRRRILDMGIVPGSEIAVKGKAPLGDPIEVKIKGYNLSLRKKEASEIYVEVI